MSRPEVRDDVRLMSGYHSPQLDVAVRLNTNEAPDAPPSALTAALHEALDGIEWNRYPDRGAEALREGIAAFESTSVERVFVANGSNEVLQSIALAYGGAGRRAMTFEPTYALHSHIAKVCGTEVVDVPRRPDFSLDIEATLRGITEARPNIVFLCSPNNPTGMIEPREHVEAIADAVADVGGLLVIDEAYGQFAPWSAVQLVHDDRPLVVTRTFSKTWSMAAVRLGYLIGPAWAVESVERVVLPYHLDAFKQRAGLAALGFVDDMNARVARLVEERGRLTTALGELDVEQWPSAANFVLFRPRSVDGDAVWSALVDRGVLVRNCASWPGLDGCLRVTIGTVEENDAFVAALTDILEGTS